MELRDRLAIRRDSEDAAPRDAFADVKDRLHAAIIGELGPQLFNADVDEAALRQRVSADLRGRLAAERGISVSDRERLASEIADDVLGHGPLERLLADESVT